MSDDVTIRGNDCPQGRKLGPSGPRVVTMVELGNALAAVLESHPDSSIVAWTGKPAFEFGETGIPLRDDENARDPVVMAIQKARKGVR